MTLLMILGSYILIGIISLFLSLYVDRNTHRHYAYSDILACILIWPIILFMVIGDFMTELKYKRVKNPFYKEKKK